MSEEGSTTEYLLLKPTDAFVLKYEWSKPGEIKRVSGNPNRAQTRCEAVLDQSQTLRWAVEKVLPIRAQEWLRGPDDTSIIRYNIRRAEVMTRAAFDHEDSTWKGFLGNTESSIITPLGDVIIKSKGPDETVSIEIAHDQSKPEKGDALSTLSPIERFQVKREIGRICQLHLNTKLNFNDFLIH